MRLPKGLSPLRHRGFRLLAGGQAASNVGDAFYAVALPWYVLAHHGGPLLLGTVLAAYGVPRTVLVAVGGHAADRWRPWTVMMVADAVRALAVGALAAVAFGGPASAALLVPVAAVLGAGEGLFLPGSFSIVPSLLADEDLAAGNALTSGGTQLATLVGPAIGGAVVALAGSGPAFTVDAVTFVVSAATLAAIRVEQRGPHHQADVAPAGATAPAGPTLRRLLASERVLQVILVVTVAANLGMGGLSEVALPALAHGPFHTGAGGYGGLIAAFSGGALAGTVLAGHGSRIARPAVVASAVFVVEGVLTGIVPYLGGPIPAGVALIAVGAMNGFGNIVTITAFQRWAPPEVMGRLMGLLMLGSFGIFPISVAVSGAVVHAWGPSVFFPLASAVLVLAALGALTQPSWRVFGSEAVLRAGAGLADGGAPDENLAADEPDGTGLEVAGAGEPSSQGPRGRAEAVPHPTKMQKGWPAGSA